MCAAPLVIAIDGPAGSGKSTTAREVAHRLGLCCVDTGAMYRAVTLFLMDRDIDPDDSAGLNACLDQITVDLASCEEGTRVLLCGEDVTERIRDDDVNRQVSRFARMPVVREKLAQWQRRIAQQGDVVMEGRDIGTVVCPDAPVKIFLDAALDARATRRAREYEGRGQDVDGLRVKRDLAARDHADSSRDIAPLTAAPDAIRLDTSDLTIEEQVDAVVAIVRSKGYGERTASVGNRPRCRPLPGCGAGSDVKAEG